MSNKRGIRYSITRGEKVQNRGKASNGLTVARLLNTGNDVVDIINNSGVPIAVVDESKYRIETAYQASTSCMASDVYDEETGKDIAKRKCLMKYNRDKVAAIDVALADIEAIRQRLLKQREIVESRMARDAAFLEAERKN